MSAAGTRKRWGRLAEKVTVHCLTLQKRRFFEPLKGRAGKKFRLAWEKERAGAHPRGRERHTYYFFCFREREADDTAARRGDEGGRTGRDQRHSGTDPRADGLIPLTAPEEGKSLTTLIGKEGERGSTQKKKERSIRKTGGPILWEEFRTFWWTCLGGAKGYPPRPFQKGKGNMNKRHIVVLKGRTSS